MIGRWGDGREKARSVAGHQDWRNALLIFSISNQKYAAKNETQNRSDYCRPRFHVWGCIDYSEKKRLC
jgi:hypothetical protein